MSIYIYIYLYLYLYLCMYVCTYVRMYVCMYVNPPAPKVLKRGSLAVDATNGTICQSGTASVGGGHVPREPAAKKCTGLW